MLHLVVVFIEETNKNNLIHINFVILVVSRNHLSINSPLLQSRYPEGILLEGVFVHPSLVEMLDAAIEDAVDHGNW